MSDRSYDIAPNNPPVTGSALQDITRVLNNVMRGKVNTVGDITLQTSSTTTVQTDVNVGGNSMVVFMPTTANAAAEIGNGTLYVSSVGKETFTVTHANNAQADRTFKYAVIG